MLRPLVRGTVGVLACGRSRFHVLHDAMSNCYAWLGLYMFVAYDGASWVPHFLNSLRCCVQPRRADGLRMAPRRFNGWGISGARHASGLATHLHVAFAGQLPWGTGSVAPLTAYIGMHCTELLGRIHTVLLLALPQLGTMSSWCRGADPLLGLILANPCVVETGVGLRVP